MTSDDLKNGVARYWQAIIVMVGIILAWGNLQYDVAALQQAMADEKVTTSSQDKKQNEVEKAIVKIETTQKAMQEDVGEIKAEQKEQSDKLDKIIEKLSER